MYAKKAVNEKIAGYRETAGVLPTSIPRRVGLLAGICWTKSQNSRLFPGAGAVLTNWRKVHRVFFNYAYTYTQVAMENHVNFYL